MRIGPGHVFAKRIGIVLLVIEHGKLFLQDLKTLRGNRAGGNDSRCVPWSKVLHEADSGPGWRKMKHHATEHLVALRDRMVDCDTQSRSRVLNANFLRHQPQQQVNIIALTKQQRQLGLLKRVRSRLVNSSPSIGTMLMVGFSETLPPKIGISTAPASPPAREWPRH